MQTCKTVGATQVTAIRACQTRPTTRYGQLGFSASVKGVGLGLLTQQYHAISPKRGRNLPVQAFIVAPALLRMTQRIIVRAAPGRLLFEAAKRGGWRVAAPLTVGLFIYSLLATWWAAKQTKRVQTLQSMSMSQSSMQSADFADNLPMISGDVPQASIEQFVACNLPDACPLCQGRGAINWEGLKVHKGEPCPRCLGSGFSSRRGFIWGK